MEIWSPTTTVAPARRRRTVLWSAAALVACGGLAAGMTACSSPQSGSPTANNSRTSGSSSASASAAAKSAVITTAATVRNGMDPVTPVTSTVADGTFTAVTMTNQAGKHVTAALSAGDTSWHTTEVLGYGKTYTIVAQARGGNGVTTTHTTRFTTMTPRSQVQVNMDRMGDYGLYSGTYGVAIIPVVHFDSVVHDRVAAQKALSVSTSTPVHGVWSWIDDSDVAYRPESYWPAHTKVTVNANVYGVDLGHHAYGASDESVSFTIGRKQLTVADDNAPKAVDKVRVYNAAGQVIRTMNTSMGKHGGTTVDGQYINFYTLNGTYTVLEHDNPAIMSSASYGLPVDDGGYAPFKVPYSTKISVGGIYLHQYNYTEYDQNHGIDDSEGCLNLMTDNARWFYDHSLIGDPVVVHGAPGAPEIQPYDGGLWSVPWATWTADSAVH